MRTVKSDKKNFLLAVQYLQAGKSVVYPTDTAYGLAVDATDAAAVKRLYRLKGRTFKKPVHVVVASLAMAKKYAKFDGKAERVFKKFLPGRLTLILPQKFSTSPGLRPPIPWASGRGRGEVESWKLLSAGTGTLGIRMPKNRAALSLVRKLGRPMTTTSANLAGASTCYSARAVAAQFKNQKYQPDLILDAGRLKKIKPSTIVDLTGKSVKILRRGPVSEQSLKKVISGL